MLWDATHKDIAKLCVPLSGIRPTVTYHVSTTRNAWWSTTLHLGGLNFSNLLSAQDHCEAERIQGTYFRIFEIPALAICGEKHALVVTQVNADDILKSFDVDKLDSLNALLPVSSLTLAQVFLIFTKNSSYWPESLRSEYSVLVHNCDDLKALCNCDSGTRWVNRMSRPEGSGKKLAWIEHESRVSSKYVLALSNHLQQLIK